MKYLKLSPRFIPAPLDPDRVHGLVALNTTTSVTSTAALPISGFYLSGVGALATAIVDGSGNQITSFGGGTQYTDAAAAPAHPIGNALEWNNSGTWATASAAAPLPTSLYLGTTAVSIGQQLAAASLPVILPSATITTLTPPAAITGFALEAGHLATIDSHIPALGQALAAASIPVVLTAAQITTLTPVSAVTATLQTQTDTVMVGGVNIKEINAVTPLMGNGVTGTGSLRVTIASDNTAFAVNSTLSAETTKVIGVTRTADGAGNLLTSNSTTYTAKFGLDGNLLGTLGTAFTDAGHINVQGAVATNVAVADKLLNIGAQAVSSENTAVTATRMAQLVTDLVGKLIVLPYANPENFVSGRATATDTTSTSLIASPGGSLRNYITQITVWNSSAVSTYIKIQDGSGGTELYDIPAPAGGGATLTLPTPLRQPTTATAIYFAANASANAVFISASGYKGV